MHASKVASFDTMAGLDDTCLKHASPKKTVMNSELLLFKVNTYIFRKGLNSYIQQRYSDFSLAVIPKYFECVFSFDADASFFFFSFLFGGGCLFFSFSLFLSMIRTAWLTVHQITQFVLSMISSSSFFSLFIFRVPFLSRQFKCLSVTSVISYSVYAKLKPFSNLTTNCSFYAIV